MTQFDLHLGDCVAGMAHLEAASVDLVVTSPPYNLGIRYGKYSDSQDRAVLSSIGASDGPRRCAALLQA